MRQLQPESLEAMLLVSADKITVAYAEALLVATPAAILVDGKKPTKLSGVTKAGGENGVRDEQSSGAIQDGRTNIWSGCSQPGSGQGLFLAKLLENESVTRYLKQRQPDVLAEF